MTDADHDEIDPDYDEIDVLIDTDPIKLGERCRAAEAALSDLTASILAEMDYFDNHKAGIYDSAGVFRILRALITTE